jgi:Trk-type K+ transport system membrane component
MYDVINLILLILIVLFGIGFIDMRSKYKDTKYKHWYMCQVNNETRCIMNNTELSNDEKIKRIDYLYDTIPF